MKRLKVYSGKFVETYLGSEKGQETWRFQRRLHVFFCHTINFLRPSVLFPY